jgi:hypothetical protein
MLATVAQAQAILDRDFPNSFAKLRTTMTKGRLECLIVPLRSSNVSGMAVTWLNPGSLVGNSDRAEITRRRSVSFVSVDAPARNHHRGALTFENTPVGPNVTAHAR